MSIIPLVTESNLVTEPKMNEGKEKPCAMEDPNL